MKKINISIKDFDFSNVFLFNSIKKLLKYTRLNNYIINLIDNKLSPHSLIHNLNLVEFGNLKIYIKTNLISKFIQFLISLASILILFIYKKNKCFYF